MRVQPSPTNKPNNPFSYFRQQADEDDSSDESSDEPAATIVTEGWCHSKGRAVRRMSDGVTVACISYEKHTDGFLRAVFSDGGKVALELPNGRYVDGKVTVAICVGVLKRNVCSEHKSFFVFFVVLINVNTKQNTCLDMKDVIYIYI